MPDDVNDSFKALNAMIQEWNLERTIQVNPHPAVPTFPDLTTDVPYWTPYEHVLLTTMAVRLRQIYSLLPIPLDVQIAASALKAFSAINQHYIPPLWQGAPESVGETIFLALRMAGRINDQQSVAAGSKDVYDAMTLLMLMLTQWQRKRWLIWSEKELALISTGATVYTIGPGQDSAPRGRTGSTPLSFGSEVRIQRRPPPTWWISHWPSLKVARTGQPFPSRI
jgi:hypothetical protein